MFKSIHKNVHYAKCLCSREFKGNVSSLYWYTFSPGLWITCTRKDSPYTINDCCFYCRLSHLSITCHVCNVTILTMSQWSLLLFSFLFRGIQGQCTFTDDTALKYGDKALTSGCSDGGREGFFTHPSVAGCKGWWFGQKNLRARRTPGAKCGDDIGTWGRFCNQPADLCQAGWHVCGTYGDVFEIQNRVSL